MGRSVEKRDSYLSLSMEKTQVATYASIHSVRTAIKHTNKKFGKDLKESMVRDWVKVKSVP